MTHSDTAAELTVRAEARRVYGPTIDALLDQLLRLQRVCEEQHEALNFAWGRVDELHQAVTRAEVERDRSRGEVDRVNAERQRLAEELAAAQAANRDVEPELRQRIARDLRGELLTGLIAALIVNATPTAPSAFELSAHLLGELADMTDGREPTIGRPADERRIDEARLRWLATLAAAVPAAPAALPAAPPVLVDEPPRRRWWRRSAPS
ncbi:hypothetical protein M3G91_15425 [Micromonospora chalcea]|uniref:hypothetical protein n=1 Tax=Micromonospora chalcea TaxID=1874 RepID=UPI0021A45A40|nr:hypothetical protein [Micromonospora chalcea]MCT2279012.1 hypothetical protein [Micromonospora chalcea]